VVRHATFHAAAAELGYTQSAISQQIAALERAVGRPLLLRPGGRRGAELTDAGRILLGAAEAVLSRLEAAAQDLDALASGENGTARLGGFESIVSQLVPPVLSALERDGSGVEVDLQVRPSVVELERSVAFGELDLTFTIPPVDDPLLELHELFAEPSMLLVRRDDPLAAAEELSAADLQGRRLAGFFNCRHGTEVEQTLRGLAVRPGIVVRADDNATLLEIVRSGTAIAVAPALVARESGRDVVAIDASALLPPRRVCLCWAVGRPLSPAAEAVREVLLETGGRLAPRLTGGRGTLRAIASP
jgi:DNA-binding transcriptional LysR family regulator